MNSTLTTLTGRWCKSSVLALVLSLPFSPMATQASKISSSYLLRQDLQKYTSWALKPTHPNAAINLGQAYSLLGDVDQLSDVKVAVVDTGIDLQHPFLQGNILQGRDYSKSAKNALAPTDSHGHGTHVAGIIKSVNPPKSKLIPLKYYDPKASGTENLQSTIKALRFAVESNVDIINYSGGGPEASDEERKILLEAERKGILVVAAAGNEKSDIDQAANAYYPASYGLSNIITVAAHDENLQLLKASNYGNKSVDLSAPGHHIKSSTPHNRSGHMTGTSQATAFVTGVASLIKAKYPQLTGQELKSILRNSAVKSNTLLGKVYNGGKLDAARAIEQAGLFMQKAQRNLAKTKPVRNLSSGLTERARVFQITP